MIKRMIACIAGLTLGLSALALPALADENPQEPAGAPGILAPPSDTDPAPVAPDIDAQPVNPAPSEDVVPVPGPAPVLETDTAGIPDTAVVSQIVDEWITWLAPTYLPGATSSTIGFPQALIGVGKIAPTCGQTVQQDHYVGTQAAIDAVMVDRTLDRTDGVVEDHAIVQDWNIVSGDECLVAHAAFASITRAPACGAIDTIGDNFALDHASLVGTLDRTVGTHAAQFRTDASALFPAGVGVSDDRTTLTLPYTIGQNATCPTNACTPGAGDTSTDLAPTWVDIDTRSAGHSEYVSGGLHIWTDDNSSNAKVSQAHAGSFPLSSTGTLGVDWTGSDPGPGLNLFVNFGADGTGTLVYEGVYGQDLWLTNGSSAAVKANAPVNGGGNGSQWHGTIDQWLTAYPDATVTAFAFSYGSGVHGDGVLHGVTINCATYSFDAVPIIDVTPPVVTWSHTDWTGSPVCGEDSFEQTRTTTKTTQTYHVEVVDGGYVNVADEPTSMSWINTRTVQIDATPCPTQTPTQTPSATPSATPVVAVADVATPLAQTGSNDAPLLFIGGALILGGATLVLAARRRKA